MLLAERVEGALHLHTNSSDLPFFRRSTASAESRVKNQPSMPIIAGSVGLGMLFDQLFTTTAVMTTDGDHHEAWWAIATAVALSLLLVRYAIEDTKQWWSSKTMQQSDSPALVIHVSGLTCGGCVSKLRTALQSTDGIDEAVVTLDPSQAIVRGTLDENDIHAVITNTGFNVVA